MVARMAHASVPTAQMIKSRIEEIVEAVESVDVEGVCCDLPAEVVFTIPREEGVTISFAVPLNQGPMLPSED